MMRLRNCRLIPELSAGFAYTYADIEIEDGNICAVRKAGTCCNDTDAADAADTEEIDCHGMTLLPGFFDLHAHLSIASARETAEDGMERLIQAIGRLQAYTDLGITTLRDCGSCLRLAVPLGRGISKGVLKGPRILASGYMLAPPMMEELGCQMTKNMRIAEGADSFCKAAEQELAKGADFIKLYASASASKAAGQDAGEGSGAILTREEIRAAATAAEAAGTYAAAHAHSLASIKLCIEEGVRTIENATFIDHDTADAAASRRNTYLVPTFAVMMPEEGTADENAMRRIEVAAERIGYAYRAGCKMGFGTDLYNGDLSRFYHEFRIRRELCGMKNIDILLQATKYSAEIAGIADQTGEIREGLCADLTLIEGKPDEDIRVMYKKPKMVIQAGERLR